MNKKILPVFICAALTNFFIKSSAQNANTTLSNLTSPTKVNVNLLPGVDDKHDLGGPVKAWRNLYLDSALYLNGNKFISRSNVTNIFIGDLAGFANTTGLDNIANGYYALVNNTTGNENTANGMYTLSTGTNSSLNTANGYAAMEYGDGGFENTAIGGYALFNNYGNSNTALGAEALVYNIGGSYNVAVGIDALSNSDHGDHLVAVGDSALYNLDGGSGHCTAVGSQAGIKNTTGSDNTFLGYHAGNTITTGSSNTIIGYGADVNGGGVSNATAIGNLAVVDVSNHIHIGNSSVTKIGGQVGWSTFSDARIKNNIQQNVPGLAFINLLKPVTYHYDVNKQENISGRKTEDWNGKYDIEKTQFTGFIAQDVEAAAKKINYDFSGVDIPKNDKDLYSLRYSDFVVPLVKAVQELSKINDTKDSIIQIQNNKIDDLENRLSKIETMMNVSSASSLNQQQIIKPAVANLSQNSPNPFSNSTTISYSIPQQFSSAKIIVTDKNGNVLKQINISQNKGSVNVDASSLINGAYQYSLYVDGRLIDSKQMIISK